MLFFFFNGSATTDIYTLSLHDALPILQYSPNNLIFYVSLVDGGTLELIRGLGKNVVSSGDLVAQFEATWSEEQIDRKSTRLNSSHLGISYAVFCLKKKKKTISNDTHIR